MQEMHLTNDAPHAYGVVRFSYPARDGFRIQHRDLRTRRAFLYAKDRLQLRLDIFKHITLASYHAQRDHAFTLALMVGDQMPHWALEQLIEMTDNIDQVALFPMREGRYVRLAVRDVFKTLTRHEKGPVLQFRQDDDDAVSLDFIAALRCAAEIHKPLLQNHDAVALDFCDGLHAMLDPDRLKVRRFRRRGLGLALGALIKERVDISIYDENHDAFIAQYPAPPLDLPDAYLRLYHRHNDCFDPNAAIIQSLQYMEDRELAAICQKMGITGAPFLQLAARADALASS